MTDASIMPLLAHLVDVRYVGGYGSVYSIAQLAISLGFAIGWLLQKQSRNYRLQTFETL
jgi:hypothetical protein